MHRKPECREASSVLRTGMVEIGRVKDMRARASRSQEHKAGDQ